MDCIFCKIVKREIPSYTIYEDKKYLGFLDISQFTPGHTIVIPKNHIEFIWDSKEIGKYFAITQKIAKHFRSLGFKYVDSLTFGRKVPHAHVHLVPHNGNPKDYKKALLGLGILQEDTSRRLTPSSGQKLVQKFRVV
jgi:histidine triad (HIT) family protein